MGTDYIPSADLAGMVENNDLGVEGVAPLGWVILGIASDVATADLLYRDVLDIEADVITRLTFGKLLVVHFDRLDFGGHPSRSKGDDHTSLDNTGLDTTDGNSSDTANLVDILEWKTERLVRRTAGRVDAVDGLEKSLARDLGFGLLLPPLVPGAVGRNINHVVAVEPRDGDERYRLWVVSDFLDERARFFTDFLVAVLRPFGGIHFVDSNNELPNTEGECKQSVLASLPVLGDTSLKFTSASSNDEDSAVSLRGARNHVLYEVPMARGINNSDIVLGGFEFPQGNVDGDTTLTLGLELVEHPCVLEGTLA